MLLSERQAPRIPQVLPENRVLRARMISFLHRLVECLGDRLLPMTADASTVSDVCALLSQLAIRYKAALAPLLAEVRYFPTHIFNSLRMHRHAAAPAGVMLEGIPDRMHALAQSAMAICCFAESAA